MRRKSNKKATKRKLTRRHRRTYKKGGAAADLTHVSRGTFGYIFNQSTDPYVFIEQLKPLCGTVCKYTSNEYVHVREKIIKQFKNYSTYRRNPDNYNELLKLFNLPEGQITKYCYELTHGDDIHSDRGNKTLVQYIFTIFYHDVVKCERHLNDELTQEEVTPTESATESKHRILKNLKTFKEMQEKIQETLVYDEDLLKRFNLTTDKIDKIKELSCPKRDEATATV
jgi:hypothetical protein